MSLQKMKQIHKFLLIRSKKYFSIIFLLISLFIGTFIRIIAWHVYPLPCRDAYLYEKYVFLWSQNDVYPILDSSGAINNISPLPIYFFKTMHQLFPAHDIIRAGTIINIFFGLFLIIILWAFALIVFKSKYAAAIAALLAATNPFLIESSIQMTRENSYLFFSAIAILFLIIFLQRQKAHYIIIIALFSSLAYLCRHEAIELISFYAIESAVLLFAKKITWQKTFVYFLIFCIIFTSSLSLCTYLIGCPKDFLLCYIQKIHKLILQFHA